MICGHETLWFDALVWGAEKCLETSLVSYTKSEMTRELEFEYLYETHEIRNIFELDAAYSEVCRFDWSEHDQANLDIVISKIKRLYIKALEKAGSKVPLSQVTRVLNLSGIEESTGEDLGPSSSAQTQDPEAAGSKKPSGHNLGSISSAKTQNLKASVPKSASDEELDFRRMFPGKSASAEHPH